MPRILELDAIDGEPVGGKATGLARLREMGLRVPDAIVLVEATTETSASELAACVDAIHARFSAKRLAIRSSALGEDGEDASFAGQYETVLDVEGRDAIASAIDACLRSADNARASAYREARDEAATGAVMSIVIQRMVDARVSGVCFTVCPVTNRRNRLVLDVVAGLGEALVSGHASPDHEEFLREEAIWEPTQRTGEEALLSSAERETVAFEALEAETRVGAPLDLEWSIDRDGVLQWLQARPITTLGLDPQCLDTPLEIAGDVYTRCNVGEMMPGAISPLTYSTCAQGIDIGWQRIKDDVGMPRDEFPDRPYLGMSHGHLFINMSEGARFSCAVTGGSADQQSLALCGRLVPEVVTPPAPPLHVRLPRIFRQSLAILRPRPRIRRLEALVAEGEIVRGATALDSWRAIDARMDGLREAYQIHLVVSSGAGALAPILLARLAGGEEPSDEHHAIVAAVLAGAEGVESADIAEGAERILDALLQAKDRSAAFVDRSLEDATAWLRGTDSGVVGVTFRDYLSRHGHRSLRELDIRQPEWSHDPAPLVRSLQTQLRGRLAATDPLGERSMRTGVVQDRPEGAARFDRIRGLAHAAVRNRERCKSLLVGLTVVFKRAYRALGEQLVAEGRLQDSDAVYFLFHEELEELAREAPGHPLKEESLARREVLAYQQTLRFPEVAVGRPQPEPVDYEGADDRIVVGKPVSRGCVTGLVRVVQTLEEAESLEPGEILVAPITDVGWTPYFAIISGLVTDVGSAVSHGAVVAREYGLPAVLNTRNGTSILRTGERVRLDGDRGTIERLD